MIFIKDGQMLGYAFVQYTSYFEAVKAMNIINGLELKGLCTI